MNILMPGDEPLLHCAGLDRGDEMVRALGAELVARFASATAVIARAKYAHDAYQQAVNG